MSLSSAIVALLKADSGVVAQVAARVYPGHMPRTGSMPCLVYQVISANRSHALDAPTDLVDARVQVTAWAGTALAAQAAGDAVRAALNGWSGTSASLVIHRIEMQDEAEDDEPAEGLEAAAAYGVRQDYRVWTREA